jgi:hypothetical protein
MVSRLYIAKETSIRTKWEWGSRRSCIMNFHLVGRGRTVACHPILCFFFCFALTFNIFRSRLSSNIIDKNNLFKIESQYNSDRRNRARQLNSLQRYMHNKLPIPPFQLCFLHPRQPLPTLWFFPCQRAMP